LLPLDSNLREDKNNKGGVLALICCCCYDKNELNQKEVSMHDFYTNVIDALLHEIQA
jgi:hypothetical protein